ncbi:MAG: mechanosensitive ion channel family protein [Candidatus Omnitrophica bacterium]|nr:mechanosensitive ion channel family protein [Candidatus Omnitrophota bacterium]MBU3933145.1 mechanosensitive ion channel family protein [Candidatus Omnitrophota bacterium]
MVQQIIEQAFLGNRILDYLISALLLLIGFGVIKIFQRFILKRLKVWAEKTATTLDDFLVKVIQSVLLPLAYFGAFYLSVTTLNLNPLLKRIIDITGMAILTLFTARLATALVGYGFNVYRAKRGKDISLERSLNGILKVIKTVVWALAIIFFLDNLGFKISAVIAGLGIGGIAVALAAQAILGDLFSYFAILFDRPFEVGDFIILGDYLGTIEHIGIKTTRIRSLSGEQLVLSNTDLTKSRLRNYKRMGKRRVVFKIGVTYQTPLDELKTIPGIIENIIKGIKDAAFDRAHFFSYGDFSLIFETVYYVMSRDYNKYMDTQQEINFAIKKEFEARSIEFAYPTQTLYLTKSAE